MSSKGKDCWSKREKCGIPPRNVTANYACPPAPGNCFPTPGKPNINNNNEGGDAAINQLRARVSAAFQQQSRINVEAEVDRLVGAAKCYCEKEKFKLKQYYEEEMRKTKKNVIQEFKCAMEREIIGPMKAKMCNYEAEIQRLKKDLETACNYQIVSYESKEHLYKHIEQSHLERDLLDAELDKAHNEKKNLVTIMEGEMKRKSVRNSTFVRPPDLPQEEEGQEEARLAESGGFTTTEKDDKPDGPRGSTASEKRKNSEGMASMDFEEGRKSQTVETVEYSQRRSSAKSSGPSTAPPTAPQIVGETEVQNFLPEEVMDSNAIEAPVEVKAETDQIHEDTQKLLDKIKELTVALDHAQKFTEEEIADLIKEDEIAEERRLKIVEVEEENEKLRKRIEELLKQLEGMGPLSGGLDEENSNLRKRIQELESTRGRASLEAELAQLRSQMENLQRLQLEEEEKEAKEMAEEDAIETESISIEKPEPNSRKSSAPKTVEPEPTNLRKSSEPEQANLRKSSVPEQANLRKSSVPEQANVRKSSVPETVEPEPNLRKSSVPESVKPEPDSRKLSAPEADEPDHELEIVIQGDSPPPELESLEHEPELLTEEKGQSSSRKTSRDSRRNSLEVPQTPVDNISDVSEKRDSTRSAVSASGQSNQRKSKKSVEETIPEEPVKEQQCLFEGRRCSAVAREFEEQIEGLRTRIRELESSLETLAEKDNKIKELEAQMSEMDQLRADIERLKKDLETASSYKDENSNLKKRIEELQAESDRGKASLEAELEKLRAQVEELHRYKSDQIAFATRVHELEEQLGVIPVMEGKIKELEAQVLSMEQLRGEIDRLTKELEDARNKSQNESAELGKQFEECTNGRASLEAEIERLRAQLEELQRFKVEWEEMAERIRELEDQLEASSDMAKMKNNDLEAKALEISKLQDEIQRLKKELEAALKYQNDNMDLLNRIQECTLGRSNLEDELERFRVNLEELQRFKMEHKDKPCDEAPPPPANNKPHKKSVEPVEVRHSEYRKPAEPEREHVPKPSKTSAPPPPKSENKDECLTEDQAKKLCCTVSYCDTMYEMERRIKELEAQTLEMDELRKRIARLTGELEEMYESKLAECCLTKKSNK